MVKCSICGEKLEFVGVEKIPLDIDGEEIRPGSYQLRPILPQNQKFRTERMYGCRKGCTRINEEEYSELLENERLFGR